MQNCFVFYDLETFDMCPPKIDYISPLLFQKSPKVGKEFFLKGLFMIIQYNKELCMWCQQFFSSTVIFYKKQSSLSLHNHYFISMKALCILLRACVWNLPDSFMKWRKILNIFWYLLLVSSTHTLSFWFQKGEWACKVWLYVKII